MAIRFRMRQPSGNKTKPISFVKIDAIDALSLHKIAKNSDFEKVINIYGSGSRRLPGRKPGGRGIKD